MNAQNIDQSQEVLLRSQGYLVLSEKELTAQLGPPEEDCVEQYGTEWAEGYWVWMCDDPEGPFGSRDEALAWAKGEDDAPVQRVAAPGA